MLTQQQIDAFHRDGFLIIRNVFEGRELDQLRHAADVVQAEGVAEKGSDHLYRDIDGKKTYFRSEKMWDRDEIFQAVTVNPRLLAAIGQCTGPHQFLPVNDSFVCKLPGGNVPVEWHQDPPYGDPERKLTYEIPNFDVDIYLDHSTVENGCVWGIPGHHLVGHVDLQQYSQQELFEDFGAVPMVMNPGDVLFHCLSAPHGSIGNTTGTLRRIFYVHYMTKEVMKNCYANWVGQKRGFSDEGKRFVANMIDVRKDLGFDTGTGDDVTWTGDGFLYDGEPATPPRYWSTLQEQMSDDEIARRKQLQPLTVER